MHLKAPVCPEYGSSDILSIKRLKNQLQGAFYAASAINQLRPLVVVGLLSCR